MKKRDIGCNYYNGIIFGYLDSSFDGTFSNERVMIESDLSDIYPCQIGNITDAYNMLKGNLQKETKLNIDNIAAIIYKTTIDYFSNIDHVNTRMSYYKSYDEIESDDDIGKIANLKGKGTAMCVERAMLTQNLLKSMGIDSHFKISAIKKDDKLDVHAFNLVHHNGKYYLFDASLPTVKSFIETALITEIPEEVYLKISSPKYDTGYAIEVSHYNPLAKKDITIIYDYGRSELYKITNKEESIKK